MEQATLDRAFEQAFQQHQAGRLPEAEQLYRKILAQQPEHARALRNLGVLALQAGRPDAGEQLFRKVISLGADGESHNNLGNAHKAQGQIEQAIDCYRQAIAMQPASAEAHSNLGNALTEIGKLDEAIDACRKAIAIRPKYARAHLHLGIALQNSGQLDDAIAAFHRAIAIDPKLADAYACLGIALRDKGQIDGAISAFRSALALRPNDAATQNNLGIALRSAGQLDEAIAALQRALAIQPGLAEAHNNLGNALRDIGEISGAIAEFRKACELNPRLREAAGNVCYSLYFKELDDTGDIAEEHRRWNDQFAEPLHDSIHLHFPDQNSERCLKVGYVSPDFRDHPVGRFLLPLLKNHDHEQFEVFCYSNAARADAITSRMRGLCDHWREIAHLTDEQTAAQILADGIDILIDLSGHTAGNRLPLFALKPAAVQISYLGYPGATGLNTIDYRLTDNLSDPPGTDSEKLLRLPQTNWCFTEPQDSPQVQPPPSIRRGYVTFGSFNNLAKVTEEMLHIWGRILQAVSFSQLLLKAPGLVSAAARKRVLDVLAAQGVDSYRVELHGPEPEHASHLALYGNLDIALDTFPYNGATTTCETLWMGVPVITLAGRTHCSRVGVSLLTNAGLPEMIAAAPDEYVKLAVNLAGNPQRLEQIRQSLRQRMKASPLMDGESFAGHIESAYRQAWRTWCATASNQ